MRPATALGGRRNFKTTVSRLSFSFLPTKKMNSPAVVKILSDLVSIRSVNPALQGADPSDCEKNVAAYVADLLGSAGIKITMQEVAPGRHNVIGHAPRGKLADDKVILLSAHMDTYPASVDEMAEYVPRIENGTLFGRGSADAKGSLAAMLSAFVETLDSPYRRESFVVASIDEEHGLTGCRTLASYPMRPNLAITGEPTSLIPIYAQKGIVRSHIRVHGTVAHAAHPDKANAIFAAARLLDILNELNVDLQTDKSDCGLSSATFTPTRIESDGDMNKSPGTVQIWFDARFLPGSSSNLFLERIDEFVRARSDGEVAFTIMPPVFVSPPNRCAIDDPLVKEFFEKIEAIAGQCKPDVFSYGSEAGVLSSLASASLVFGPGDPKYSHGPGECVELREVVTAAQIFEKILVSE